MNSRSTLLAIGIAATIALLEGPQARVPVSRAPGDAPRFFITADNGARFDGIGRTGMVREVTAYNVGVASQTKDNPCVGAAGHDLCRLVREGRNVCAANFVALGTVLRIQHYGECVVLDRMNRRYAHRVDIAMKEDAVDEALEFGLRRRVVEVKQ